VVEVEEGEGGEIGDGRGQRSGEMIGSELNLFQFTTIEELVDATSEPEAGSGRGGRRGGRRGGGLLIL
jgi:hypothetical protein